MPNARSKRRSEEHTSELQSQSKLVCRLLLEKKKRNGAVPQPAGKTKRKTPLIANRLFPPFRASVIPSINKSKISLASFFFYEYGHHQALHSFPTRRSSD